MMEWEGRRPSREPSWHPARTIVIERREVMSRFIVEFEIPNMVAALNPCAVLLRTRLTGNVYITNPTPTVAVLDTAIQNHATLELNKSPATMAAVRSARRTLRTYLHHEQSAVQIVVDTKATLNDAEPIAASVGMYLRVTTPHVWPDFGAYYGGIPGAVLLRVKQVNGATNYWQHSTNQVDWFNTPESHKSRMLVTGLPVGQMCYFRTRRLVKDAYTEWSVPLQYKVI
jgi:hypothetical protein